MSEQPSWYAELDELLNKLCAEALSSDERQRLNELLRGGEEQPRHYRRYLHFHAAMKWEASQSQEGVPRRLFQEDRCVDVQPHAIAIVNGDRCTREHMPCPASVSAPVFGGFGDAAVTAMSSLCHGWPLAYLVAVLTCGAGALVGSLIEVSSPNQMAASLPVSVRRMVDRKAEFVGRITGMVGCEWSDPNTAVPGPVAVPLGRRYALASGLLEITYHAGAKVILQGPCTYEVESPAGGYLSTGKLTATLERKEERRTKNEERSGSNSSFLIPHSYFAIRTPTAIVTDLGTEFGVEVDKQGQTISRVFRGSVELRVISVDKNTSTIARVLHKDESAMVKRVDGASDAADRIIMLAAPHTQVDFVREVPKTTLKTLDLVDVVAGGDGFSGRRGRGIDPTTGRVADEQPTEHVISGDRRYHRVEGLPFVDGVFIPDGSAGPVKTDSAGHVSSVFPNTTNTTSDYLWAGGTIPVPSPLVVRTELNGVDYAIAPHGLLFLQANKGITFDLEAIRRANPGDKLLRFRATVGNTELGSLEGAPVYADLWILVDGQVRFRRGQVSSINGAFTVTLPINGNDHFLTLAATDGGNGIDWDWIVFGDPRLELASTPDGTATDRRQR